MRLYCIIPFSCVVNLNYAFVTYCIDIRNMLPDVPIAISQPCHRFFHLEDFEFAYLSDKKCPYSRLKSVVALDNILRYERRVPPAFASFFPTGTNPLALDLLTKLLQFSPDDRIGVEEAVAHPYLKDFHGHMSEPTCPYVFDFDFERQDMHEAEVRRQMFAEVNIFRPADGSPGLGSGIRPAENLATAAPAGVDAKGVSRQTAGDKNAEIGAF
jgi:serine/threonine protein kinase